VIDQVPNCVFAAVSVLPPNTEIAPHYGDTNGIVRSHLALVVPAEYPTIAIKVGEEVMGWKEGEMICFINFRKHQVWNRSDKRRYVLMVDFVPKPLQHRTMEICSKGLGSQSFIYVYKTIPLVKHLPEFAFGLMSAVATVIWRLYLPIQRRLKFL
jgi:aspartyl/asparaginyl beta-hydroxylase (cupin superfamily)